MQERLSLRPAERWRAPTSWAVQNGEDLEASGGVDDVGRIELQPVRVVDDSHVATDHRVERVGAARSHCQIESAWGLGDGAARAIPGIEPGTSRTRSASHTTRPHGQLMSDNNTTYQTTQCFKES